MRPGPKDKVLRIPPAVLRRVHAQLTRAARRAAPREANGLFFGPASEPGLLLDAVELENLAVGEGRFELDPAGWVAAEARARGAGLALGGFWHSHPSGTARPSSADASAASLGSLHGIVTPAGALAFFRRTAAGFARLDYPSGS